MNGNYVESKGGNQDQFNNGGQNMDQNQYNPYSNMQNHQYPQGMMQMPAMAQANTNII